MKKIFWVYLVTAMFCSLACSNVNKVPKDGRSVHFDEVNEHLELGGVFYAYVDIDGDIKEAAGFLDDFIHSTKEIPADMADKVDVVALAEHTGLYNVDAIGFSSYKKGDGYSNRAFIHNTGPRVGLMGMFGGTPQGFEVLSIAPVDAGLVAEYDVNASVVFKVIEKIMVDIMGQQKTQKELSDLDDPLPGLMFSPRKVLENLDTHVMTVIRMDGDRKIQIPGEDIRVPYTDLMMSVDNLDFVFDSAVGFAANSPLFRYSSDAKWETLEVLMPLPDELKGYGPTIRKDRNTGRIYVATSLSFLEECLGAGKKIGESKEFIAATEDLPIEAGNMLSYIAPRFVNIFRDAVSDILKEDKDTASYVGMLRGWLPDSETGQASMAVNMDNGILLASNTAYSHKLTLLGAGYLNPLTLGVWASIAIPAFISYVDGAKEAANVVAPPDLASTPAQVYLDLCYQGAVEYHANTGKWPESTDWTPAASPSGTPYQPNLDIWQTPTWTALGFVIIESHHYQYTFVKGHNYFACQARGDLDGDGNVTFGERKGEIRSNGEVVDLGFTKEIDPQE